MQYTRAAALVAAAAMAGGLTGCGEAEEPDGPTSTATPYTPAGEGGDSGTSGSESSSATSTSGSGTGSSSTSSSASGSGNGESSSKMPAVAKERTKDGAAAFGKYYHEQFGAAIVSGETSKIDRLSLESCPPCNAGEERISKDRKKGIGADRNPYTYSNLKAEKRPDKGYKVTVDVDVEAYRLVKGDKEVAHVDATSFQLTEHVVWSSGGWSIADWSIS